MNNETIGNLRGEIIHSGFRRAFHAGDCRLSTKDIALTHSSLSVAAA